MPSRMDTRARPSSPIRSLPYQAVLLALGLVAAGLLFTELVDIFLLVVMTAIAALPLAAGATRLQRLRVPRPLRGAACALLGLGALGLVLAFIVPPFVNQVDTFIHDLPVTLARFEHTLNHDFGLRP